MTRLYLDTEFNGFGGQLISLALVPHDQSALPAFYCELEVREQLDPWVRENVVPHLALVPRGYGRFQQKLAKYLHEVGDCTIIADWPDDIRYFCEALITGPGEILPQVPNINFVLDLNISYTSAVPHHAYHDAVGIRNYYLERFILA